MSRLAAADRIQSTEDRPTQEGRRTSETMGLNTGMDAAVDMQLSINKLNSYSAWRRVCEAKFLDISLDCANLDEQVKTEVVNNAYRNLFHREFSQITKDHIAIVKRLLELGADVNGGPSDFPLSVAVTAGSYPLVELLCQHGADLSKEDGTCGMFGYPPLFIAAKGGHIDMIEVMLKFGASIHDKVLNDSPVDLALSHGHTDCAQILLQLGAKFDVQKAIYNLRYNLSVVYINFLIVNCRHEIQQYICKEHQDLLLSAVRGKNIELISHIIDIVFDITGEYPCLEELLTRSGNGDVASFLIQKGADVNKLLETCGSYTPLYLVLGREGMCRASKLQVVKVLLENGASLYICGDTSPLMLAALTDNSADLLQLLLDFGADINWRDSKGNNVFSCSVYHGCDSNAEFLIRYVKDEHFINSQNNAGLTVLMQAARYSNVAVVKGVINHNPDMNMTDNKGNTALLHAINRIIDDYSDRIDDIVTTLINAGSDVNLQNDDGLSPLMLAASRYSTEIVQILLDAGADINAVSKTDRTKTAVSYFQPLRYYGNKDITALLAVFHAQGACLSYLQPKMFHRILLCNDSDTICKLISNGTGPVTVRSDKYFNYFSPADPTFDISPLCTALISGNASLARHFVDIMWLTKSDLTSLTHNKPVRSYLEKKNHTQCLNLLDEMSSQPVSLFRLSFVEVSSALGTTPGRENRVNKLPLPRLLKDKLLFKSAVDFVTPTIDMIPVRLLPFDPSPGLYISVRDCCKCCHVLHNFKDYIEYFHRCFACIKRTCEEWFLGIHGPQ